MFLKSILIEVRAHTGRVMAEKETPLLAAYLVVGSDELKTKTVIERLWVRFERYGSIDFNAQIIEGSREIDLTTLLDSLNTPPLASPYRLVLIKDVEKTGKVIMDALATYCKSPMPSTVLVMTAQKLTSQSRLYKAVSTSNKKAVIDASERKRSEVPAMVRQLATNYHINLSFDGAAKMSELVGSSTIALNTEVKKLASYVLALDRSDATLDDVLTVVARSNQPSVWDFVDAFSKRELVESLDLLRLLTKESPVSLLYLCVTRIREMLQYKSLAMRREGNLAKALGKPSWQLRRLESLASRYEAQELRGLLARASRADARMKSGEDAKLVLEELVLSTCR